MCPIVVVAVYHDGPNRLYTCSRAISGIELICLYGNYVGALWGWDFGSILVSDTQNKISVWIAN